jgi:Ran GTPase-activating protein 1
VLIFFPLQVLPKLQNLEVINFGDCLVRTEGAVALSDALKEGHQKLKVICYVVHFCLGQEIIDYLVNPVYVLSSDLFLFSSQELNLSGNEINKRGASTVAENMENKPSLTRLDLNCKLH